MFHGVRPNGNALRASRERQGLSLRKLGRQTHINHMRLWRIEMGLAHPSDAELHRLAGALGEPIEEITRDDPQEKA